MTRSLFVESGHQYIGGAAKPWYVSQGMIVSGAESKGFVDVKVAPRSDYPVFSLPPIPPGSQDDWNVIGTARRAGASSSLDLPDAVRWVVDITTQKADPNYELVPSGAGAKVYAPPTYPLVVPQGVDWTTTPSGPAALYLAAGVLGLTAAFIAWELFG
jgi:hypothetical protein